MGAIRALWRLISGLSFFPWWSVLGFAGFKSDDRVTSANVIRHRLCPWRPEIMLLMEVIDSWTSGEIESGRRGCGVAADAGKNAGVTNKRFKRVPANRFSLGPRFGVTSARGPRTPFPSLASPLNLSSARAAFDLAGQEREVHVVLAMKKDWSPVMKSPMNGDSLASWSSVNASRLNPTE